MSILNLLAAFLSVVSLKLSYKDLVKFLNKNSQVLKQKSVKNIKMVGVLATCFVGISWILVFLGYNFFYHVSILTFLLTNAFFALIHLVVYQILDDMKQQ